jgi:hypothetical protein
MIAALATGDPISLGVWLVHLSINLIGAFIFFPLLKPFSRLSRWTAEKIAETPRLTLIIAIVIHVVPVLMIIGVFI